MAAAALCRLIDLGDRLDTFQTRMADDESSINSLQMDILSIKTELRALATNKNTASVLAAYDSAKKSLVKSKDDLVLMLNKQYDRLDIMPYSSTAILGFIIGFNALFYTHPPAAGTKLLLVDYGLRVLLVGAFTIVIMYILLLLLEKLKDIDEQIKELRSRFLELTYTFEGLTMNQRERHFNIIRYTLPAEQQKKRECLKEAIPFDSLDTKQRVLTIERSEFVKSPFRNVSTKLSIKYINALMFFAIVSALPMVSLSVSYLMQGAPKGS